jgi:hypothetical protein
MLNALAESCSCRTRPANPEGSQLTNTSPEYMQAIVASICHDDVTFEVNGYVPRVLKLAAATSSTTNGAQASSVAETQHLHAVIFGVCNNNIAVFVQGNCERATELVVAVAFGAKRTQTSTIRGAQHLHAVITCNVLKSA